MERKLTIYPDTCFFGRPFDQPVTPDILVECGAIRAIINRCRAGGHKIITSAFVSYEIGQIPNITVREVIETYYSGIELETVPIAPGHPRAAFFNAQGLGKMDAAHLATAESAGADFLLTVDKAFIRICAKKNLSKVNVMNPLTFLNGGFI
ncbi:hypothetical protein R80B4_00120 [Fibrobacteres bacterium R8-0-B4]